MRGALKLGECSIGLLSARLPAWDENRRKDIKRRLLGSQVEQGLLMMV
jgi:hypothetical protein